MSPRNSVTPVLNLSCWILRYSHANSVEYLEAWLCRTSKPLSAFARIAVKHQGALALPRKGAWGGAGSRSERFGHSPIFHVADGYVRPEALIYRCCDPQESQGRVRRVITLRVRLKKARTESATVPPRLSSSVSGFAAKARPALSDWPKAVALAVRTCTESSPYNRGSSIFPHCEFHSILINLDV